MKNFTLDKSMLSGLLVCLLLAACETTPTKPEPAVNEVKPAPVPQPVPAPVPAAPVIGPDALAVKEGVALYNNGDYAGTIKKLNAASEIWNGGSKAAQVEALKYMAFSYCLTKQQNLCRQQFERALKLDPGFELPPGERSHPMWKDVFLKAKKGK